MSHYEACEEQIETKSCMCPEIAQEKYDEYYEAQLEDFGIELI